MNTQLEFNSPLPPALPLRRFSVAQYHQLGELGVLTPDDRVELLEGWIVEKMNQRPIHGYVVGLLSEWFQSRIRPGFIVRSQLPITTQRSEPEPDIAIVQGNHSDFRNQHPAGADCRLVVEVADTSLPRDRAKAVIYSAAGVSEYWIVNITEQCIERFEYCGDSKNFKQSLIPANSQISLQVANEILLLDLGLMFS